MITSPGGGGLFKFREWPGGKLGKGSIRCASGMGIPVFHFPRGNPAGIWELTYVVLEREWGLLHLNGREW